MQKAHPDSFTLDLPSDYNSAATVYQRPPVQGVQFHHPIPTATDGSAEVGKDYRHMSADLQVRSPASFVYLFMLLYSIRESVNVFVGEMHSKQSQIHSL